MVRVSNSVCTSSQRFWQLAPSTATPFSPIPAHTLQRIDEKTYIVYTIFVNEFWASFCWWRVQRARSRCVGTIVDVTILLAGAVVRGAETELAGNRLGVNQCQARRVRATHRKPYNQNNKLNKDNHFSAPLAPYCRGRDPDQAQHHCVNSAWAFSSLSASPLPNRSFLPLSRCLVDSMWNVRLCSRPVGEFWK